jgi:quercetin dioxygenase-like cupin family protein
MKGIGIRNILMYNALRVTLYYMPKGEIMKLHDHPKMSVINFIAKGKMEAQLYTNLKENLYRKEVHALEDNSLKFIDGMLTK